MTLIIPIHHRNLGTFDMFIDKEDYDKIKDLNLRLNYTSNPHTKYCISIINKLDKVLDEPEILKTGKTRKRVYKYVKKIKIQR